ncbi:MAG: alcohol dehydrogenase catalytic domain-containing protein [Desulfobacterales bacterium]
MKALRYLNPHIVKPEEIDSPVCSPGEALVRVHAAGICGSDMAIFTGKHPRAKAPLVMGHEFAGEIVEIQPGGVETPLAKGDRVTAYPLLMCGECWACRNGFGHVCRDLKLIGIDRDGGFAEYVSVPLDLIVKFPGSLSFDQGALIEPLAVAVHALEMAGKPDWKNAVVVGCGPIGLLVGFCLRYAGIENLLLCDISPQRVKRAAGMNFQTINSADDNPVDRVTEMTRGEGADIVFECAGSAPAALQMCDLVRPRGRIIMVSVHKEPHPVDLRAITFKEISLIGTRVYTRSDFRRAVQMMPDLPYQGVISHRFELQRGAEGFDVMGQAADACKVIIVAE